MKWPDLTLDDIKKHQNSAIFAMAVVVFLLIVHIVWIAPLSAEKEDLEARGSQQQELVRKYNEKLQQAQSIRENLVKQEAGLRDLQKYLFKGNDPYQLAATLSEMLSAKEGQKLDIKTYQVLESKEYGLYQEVHLRFNFMTTIEGFHYFLEKARNFQSALLVQEINIQKVQRKGGPDLVVNVILAALMEKKEKS
jgi:Tfp pilus assembly protein PilO